VTYGKCPFHSNTQEACNKIGFEDNGAGGVPIGMPRPVLTVDCSEAIEEGGDPCPTCEASRDSVSQTQIMESEEST